MVVGRIKQLVKQLAPKGALRVYDRYQRRLEHARNAKLSPQQVFSEIYRQGVWGNGSSPFFSGTGSADQAIVSPYVAALTAYLATLPEESRRVVDLGCGDFSVGKQILPACSLYVAVDVVPELIEHLQKSEHGPRVEFRCIDIIDDELPEGDVCLVRQVFQHLSNAQIAKVLAKLGRYRTVFITEHFPADDSAIVPNKDKVHGGGIRLFEGSAVYVDKPPFHFASAHKELFLEVPEHGFSHYGAGVIRTLKFDFADAH